jgi:hypothetical protein
VRRIQLQEAQVDMILAADVDNAQQMLLLEKGTCLTAKNLRMLKSWGIDRLYVELPANTDVDSDKPTGNFIDLEQELLSRFTGSVESPIVQEICRVAAEIIHERRARQE